MEIGRNIYKWKLVKYTEIKTGKQYNEMKIGKKYKDENG